MQTASPDNPLPIMLANVDCDNNDSSLLQCSSSPPDFRDCVRDSSVFGTRLACTNAVESAPLHLLVNVKPPEPEAVLMELQQSHHTVSPHAGMRCTARQHTHIPWQALATVCPAQTVFPSSSQVQQTSPIPAGKGSRYPSRPAGTTRFCRDTTHKHKNGKGELAQQTGSACTQSVMCVCSSQMSDAQSPFSFH